MANKLTVEMDVREDKKHVTKFSTNDSLASFTSIYINKNDLPKDCTGIRVTVEFLE